MDRSAYYTVSHPDKFSFDWKGFYDKIERLTDATREKTPNLLDVPYSNGDNPKQRLDVYFAQENKETKHPVFIFLHGGGFVEGDKDDYGFVARPFSLNGIVTVVCSYRWAPQSHYPAQVDDTRSILTWVYKNIGRYGGDSDRIFIGGHSAGAILCASVSVNSSWTKGYKEIPRDVVKGFFAISGLYDLRGSFLADPYIADSSLLVEASPILNLVDPPSSIVAVGSKEKDVFLKPSKDFIEELGKKSSNLKKSQATPKLLILDNMDHADTVLTLGDENSLLFRELLEEMAT